MRFGAVEDRAKMGIMKKMRKIIVKSVGYKFEEI